MAPKDFPSKPDGVGLFDPYPTLNRHVQTVPVMNGFGFGYHRHRGLTGTGVFWSGFSSVGTGVFLSGCSSAQRSNTPRVDLSGFNSVQHSNTSKVNLSGLSSVQHSNTSKKNWDKRHQCPIMGPPQFPFQGNGSLRICKGTGVFLPQAINNDITTKPNTKIDQQQKKSMGHNKVAAKQEAPSVNDDEALLLEFNLPQEWTY